MFKKIFNKIKSEKELSALKVIVENSLTQFEAKAFISKVVTANRYHLFVVEIKNGNNADILNLHNDIALETGAYPVRIYKIDNHEHGIEIPRNNFDIVYLKDVLGKLNKETVINIPIGENMNGDIAYKELNNFLISGATNSGKSIFIHTFVISLLNQKNKNNMEFIFIDPKKVDLYHYNSFGEYITKIEDAKNTMRRIKKETERRLKLFSKNNINNIREYNNKFSDKLNNLVIVIDEFSDLMVSDEEFFEHTISFIASCGNVAGVNIIISTSRPALDVISNKIRNSFVNIICSSTATIDNLKIIIGKSGGEKLLGQGDILFQEFDCEVKEQESGQCIINKKEIQIRRLQALFITDSEIKSFIKKI